MRKWMTDKLFLYHWVRISILLFIYDIIVMNVSYGLALWLRFDFRFSDIPYDYLTTWVKYIPIHTACTLILMFIGVCGGLRVLMNFPGRVLCVPFPWHSIS